MINNIIIIIAIINLIQFTSAIESSSKAKTYDFSKAKFNAERTINLIHQRFEFDFWYYHQFFLGSFNLPYKTWDILKYKVLLKIVEGKVNATPSKFLMIFGGSSVTAGHDNYYNESYPFVYERRIKPIFDELGIDLQVHNIAQGGNNCRPSDYCYEAMGGEDADWMGW